MIYYTADLHFHYALLLPSRPFATVEEMDEALVKNWNDTVGPEDTVYLVGDIGWNGGRVPGELLERLSGHKHLIRGNHDTGYEDAGRLYRWFETVTDFNEIDDGETHILLCHYPMLYHKRGYMIHGHLHHGRGRGYELLRQLPRVLNAGVDVNRYRPVTLAELGSRIYGLPGVENYHIVSPAADVAANDTVLPVLGTVNVTEET